jgi:hypothetical protein
MPGCRWPQFRFTLRTFLIVCVLPVPVLAWVASVKMSAVRQRAAAKYLEARSVVHVTFESPTPNLINTFFRSFIDQDAFDRATVATRYYRVFSRGPKKDILIREDIDAILQLNNLRDLDLIVGDPYLGMYERPRPKPDLPASELARLTRIPTLARFAIDADLDHESQLRVARLPELHSLRLPSTPISEEVLEILVKNSNLAYLDVDARKLSRNGIAKLGTLPLLQSLTLRHVSQEEQFLDGLSSCQALGHLEMWDSKISRTGAKVINQLRIQSLSLIYCDVERGFFLELVNSKTLDRVLVITRLHSITLNKRGFTASIEADRLQELEDHFTTSSASAPRTGEQDSP